jgi:hypothetical protein
MVHVIAFAALWGIGWIRPSLRDIERGHGICGDSTYAVLSPIHSGPSTNEAPSRSTIIVRIDAILPKGSDDIGTGAGYLYYSADGVPRLGGRSSRGGSAANQALQRLLHAYATDVGGPELNAEVFTGTQTLVRFAVTDDELSSAGLVRRRCVEWPRDQKLPFER